MEIHLQGGNLRTWNFTCSVHLSCAETFFIERLANFWIDLLPISFIPHRYKANVDSIPMPVQEGRDSIPHAAHEGESSFASTSFDSEAGFGPKIVSMSFDSEAGYGAKISG